MVAVARASIAFKTARWLRLPRVAAVALRARKMRFDESDNGWHGQARTWRERGIRVWMVPERVRRNKRGRSRSEPNAGSIASCSFIANTQQESI